MSDTAQQKIKDLKISSNIFNTDKEEGQYGDAKLFLGQAHGFFDTINKPHEDIWKLYKQMLSQAWDENEFDYSTCIQEFKSCPRGLYDAMIYNLAYQWEADSVAAQSIAPIASSFITNSELWAATLAISTNECLTPDHQVLTAEGWKPIAEVTTEDRVAQWSRNTGAIDFVRPSRTIAKAHSGPVLSFESTNFSQVVTPNHRLPVLFPYPESTKPYTDWVYASEAPLHGGVAYPNSGTVRPNGMGMTPQQKLYVAVQADGTLCPDAYTGFRTGRKHYRFSFSKERKIQRLYHLCEEAGWEVKEIMHSNKDHIRSFYVYLPAEEYNPFAKTFDWINLELLSYEWAVDFINELQYWDGNVSSSSSIRYISTNRACIDKAQTIGHLAGLVGKITYIAPRQHVLMPSGGFSDTQEGYQINFTSRQYQTGNSITRSEFHYDGMVYCLTVDTGYFVVKHNDKISITGNCLHAACYSEIVRCSFERPTEVFGRILNTVESFQRLDALTKVLQEAYEVSHKYALKMVSEEEAYDATLLFYVALYCLERIQFIASFAVTFAFGEVGMFVPIAKAIQKICQDELEVHAELDRLVLKKELATERGRESFERNKTRIHSIVNEMLKSEIDWANFLGSDGRELPGMTTDKLQQFAIFHAQPVYDTLGLTSPYERITKNPLPFTEDWMNINSIQASPQEEKGRSSSYLIGRISNRGKEESFSFDDI